MWLGAAHEVPAVSSVKRATPLATTTSATATNTSCTCQRTFQAFRPLPPTTRRGQQLRPKLTLDFNWSFVSRVLRHLPSSKFRSRSWSRHTEHTDKAYRSLKHPAIPRIDVTHYSARAAFFSLSFSLLLLLLFSVFAFVSRSFTQISCQFV